MKLRQNDTDNRMSGLTKAKLKLVFPILALVLIAGTTAYGIYMGRSLIGLIAGWCFSILLLWNVIEGISKEKRYAAFNARFVEEQMARSKARKEALNLAKQ